MGWRDRITKAVVDSMQASGRRPAVIPPGHYDPATHFADQYAIDSVQRAEGLLNQFKGDRMGAAEQALQDMRTPHPVMRENIRREGTLGVLQSEEPLMQWWNTPEYLKAPTQ